MSFELVIKKAMSSRLGEDYLSVGKSTITFGDNVGKMFNLPFIEVYFDVKKNLVGFKESNNSTRAYKIHIAKKNQKWTNPKKYVTGSFISAIPKGRYKTYRDGDMICFNAGEIARN